jgi:hypothetical protein
MSDLKKLQPDETASLGGRPPERDVNRPNCELSNLEWAAGPATRDEFSRAKAIATRHRADAIRHTLEGRQHSDSAELVAEDRLR